MSQKMLQRGNPKEQPVNRPDYKEAPTEPDGQKSPARDDDFR